MKNENIAKFYQKYKLYIFPLTVAFSGLILVVFVIYPQTARLITNQKSQGDFLNRANMLEVKAQTLDSYDSEDLGRRVQFVQAAYPTDKDFAIGMGLLQEIISKSGFIPNSILLEAESAKGASQSYNLKVEILGPVSLLADLLKKIENSARLMRVGGIETGTGKEAQKESNISLHVEMLYSSAPSDFGSVDSPLPELSEKDEEIIAKLTRSSSTLPSSEVIIPGPRGRSNPFE